MSLRVIGANLITTNSSRFQFEVKTISNCVQKHFTNWFWKAYFVLRNQATELCAQGDSDTIPPYRRWARVL